MIKYYLFFFFQAEDGIRDGTVTGVQTCALPILYQQAEQIIVNDAPVLFTTHGLSFELVKPYLKGYVFTPISVPLERYLWIRSEERRVGKECRSRWSPYH